MIINMSLKLLLKTRNNIKNHNGQLDAGWYTENDKELVLLMGLNNYFIKTVITMEDLKNLEKPNNNDYVVNKPVFFESMKLSVEDFKKKYLNDFVKVISFE